MGSGPCTIYRKGSEIQSGHSFLLMHTYRLFYNKPLYSITINRYGRNNSPRPDPCNPWPLHLRVSHPHPQCAVANIPSHFSAQDKALLAKHRISHILSILRWEDLHSNGHFHDSTPAPQGTIGRVIQRKQVEIADAETEDILTRLTEMTDWIHDALTRPHPHGNANPGSTKNGSAGHTGGCVLVHCNKGISRSGAVVVAYSMWHFPFTHRRSTQLNERTHEVKELTSLL